MVKLMRPSQLTRGGMVMMAARTGGFLSAGAASVLRMAAV
jgi:hypothetical protein